MQHPLAKKLLLAAFALGVSGIGCGGEVFDESSGELLEAEEQEDDVGGTREAMATFPYCKSDHGFQDAPDTFWTTLKSVAGYLSQVPDHWGDKSQDAAKCMSRITCQEASWRIGAMNKTYPRYKGMYQIDTQMYLINGKYLGEVTMAKYWYNTRSKDKRGTWRSKRWWQQYAGFKYLLRKYSSPCAAWRKKLERGWW